MENKLEIKSIILKNGKELDVEQILDNGDGIKFYITDIKNQISDDFDIYKGIIRTLPLYKLKVKTIENKIYTLFDCFYTVRENEKLYIHLIFKEIIKENVDKRNFECDKLIVRFDESINKNKVFLGDIDFSLKDINVCYIVNQKEVIISSNNITDTNELFSYFADFYELINLIIGYFPTIIQTTYMLNSKIFVVENDVVDKYYTDNKYKNNIFSFLNNLNSKDIEESYIKYREFSKKALLQLSMYFMATMEKKSYIEVDVVNILQTLDGLYDKLSVFENEQKDFSDEMNMEIIDLIKDIDFLPLKEKYKSIIDVNTKITGCIRRLNFFSYRKKLKNMFKYNDYLLFKEEMKRNNKPFIEYDTFIQKCINSRNRLSHVDENEIYLFENENTVYIHKLILLFRLLILQEVGLDTKINMLNFKCGLSTINNYIREILPH